MGFKVSLSFFLPFFCELQETCPNYNCWIKECEHLKGAWHLAKVPSRCDGTTYPPTGRAQNLLFHQIRYPNSRRKIRDLPIWEPLLIYLGISYLSFRKPVVFFIFIFPQKALMSSSIPTGKGGWKERPPAQRVWKGGQSCSGRFKAFPEHNGTREWALVCVQRTESWSRGWEQVYTGVGCGVWPGWHGGVGGREGHCSVK